METERCSIKTVLGFSSETKPIEDTEIYMTFIIYMREICYKDLDHTVLEDEKS